MADVVWSMLAKLPGTCEREWSDMVRTVDLWARHLRGPGRHEGPIVLLSNADMDVELGVRVVPVELEARQRRELFIARPRLALRHLAPGPDDRYMQLDLDALARHSVAPLFEAVRRGEVRVAPSMFAPTADDHAGHFLGAAGRLWYGRIRGFDRRPGISASVTACYGSDWQGFMGGWVALIERFLARAVPIPELGDQAYLNYLYACEGYAMAPFGPAEVHHLRVDDPAGQVTIGRARILHFPLPDKLARMSEWSVV